MTKSKNDSNKTEIGDKKKRTHTRTHTKTQIQHKYLCMRLLGKNKYNRDHE